MSKQTLILVVAFVAAAAAFVAASGLLQTDSSAPPVSVRVLLASEVEWQALNPLRGDKSPRAGTLWGDRSGPVPCGFLVKFVDGFSSPPHIHPVTYRGMVISGLVHNDTPKAEEVWLAPGSFWTQPAGEVHITAAKGNTNVAYIEIEKGPYLVHPADQAFERPEAPIKMDPSKMPWGDAPGMQAGSDGPKVAALAGNPGDDQLRRTAVKLPAGFAGTVQSDGATLHVVVIQGNPTHEVPGKAERKVLDPGSYFGSEGKAAHRLSCEGDCLLYVRTKGSFDVTATQ